MNLPQNPVKDGKSNELSLKVPSILENIRMVESFIDNARELFPINDENYGNVVIAITEAVNNAIVHGNKQDKGKMVSISMKYEIQALTIKIVDEGTGFPYEDLPDPTAPENLEKETGRGIFLMKHLSDEVHFNPEGTQVELVFYLDE